MTAGYRFYSSSQRLNLETLEHIWACKTICKHFMATKRPSYLLLLTPALPSTSSSYLTSWTCALAWLSLFLPQISPEGLFLRKTTQVPSNCKLPVSLPTYLHHTLYFFQSTLHTLLFNSHA